MPSLESVDRVHTEVEHEQGYFESAGTQGHSFAAVGPSPYGKPEVSGTSLGAPVGETALSTREVAFPSMLAVESSTL